MDDIQIWSKSDISDDIEAIYALYGHDYIGEDLEALRDMIAIEFNYRLPLYVLEFLARSADDF